METLPAWNNESEYKTLSSPDFQVDLETAQELTTKIQMTTAQAVPLMTSQVPANDRAPLVKHLQDISLWVEQATVLLSNLISYVECEISVDAKNSAAVKSLSKLEAISTELSTAATPFEIFLTRCEEAVLTDYLNSERTTSESFMWREKRKTRDLLLSTEEEMTITQFRQFGMRGWSQMYEQISGNLKVKMPEKGEIGAAEAAGYLRSADPVLRKEAWEGLQSAWKGYEEPCAAVLNNIVGFRLEEYKKRSHTRKIDFLEFPLVQSRIERATLEAMLSAVHDRIEVPRRAMRLMALCMGKTQIDPWDLLAPSPRTGKGQQYTFEKGVNVIRAAFHSVDPSMGEFVDMMVEKQWIEARVLPNKQPGAYCTGFLKSRSPRVFQTFMGSYDEVSTLAHELGHAFHSWVIRDLPLVLTDYPMTLAETASIFAETVLSDRVMESGDAETKFGIAWASAIEAALMLANIPARYDFENTFYQARSQGSLSPDELSDLTEKSWRKWYGQEISQTEKQYWMTKLHFSMSGTSFYNFPYTFGYLFSLGIYAKREELGAGFFKAYIDILRDTGSMTAEDLIQKHLGQDIRKPEFWLRSIDMVEKKIAQFEKMMQN